MHELAETERLLEVVLQQARQAQARQVTALHVVIGHESTLSPDSLQFYWDSISRGTLAEGAHLYFRAAPDERVCMRCQRLFTPVKSEDACPVCGCAQAQPVTDEAFYLEAMDVEST